jgi:hypothetical protein
MGRNEDLGERIAEQAAHLDAATHRLLTDIRSFEACGEWAYQGFRSCADWLSWRVGWSGGTARDRVRVATKLGEFPLIDDAPRRGELSYCKVRAILRVATPANELLLVEDARFTTGAQLEKVCRKYAAVLRNEQQASESDDLHERFMSRHQLENGMVEIKVTMHADEAEVVWTAIEQLARDHVSSARSGSASALTEPGAAPNPAADNDTGSAQSISEDRTAHQSAPDGAVEAAGPDLAPVALAAGAVRFDRVTALVHLAQQVVRGERPNRSPTEVVVTVPVDVLTRSEAAPVPVACLGDGTCVSAETARRLSCDCGVVYMQEDPDGNTISVGRKTRSISAGLKRALLKRDRTCRFPGCSNRIYLEGHHVRHWADGGETRLENMVGLCSLCRARHKPHYSAYLVMPRSRLGPDEGRVLYAA